MITLQPGEMFQRRYRLIEPLGEGAYSQVWLATQTTLDKQVVIKIMRDNLVGKSPQLVKRFLQEARILSSINHPNIVRVLDADVVDGRPYFVMDYVPGQDLHHVLAATPEYRLQPLEVVSMMEFILQGLIEAHSLNVVHLDMKPENVLVGADGVVKILDFGIALIAETESSSRLTKQGTMGTPGYMAPEIKDSRLTAGPTTDIYAAGVILFVLCGGRLDLPEGKGIADLSRSEVREGYFSTLRGEYAPLIGAIRRATAYSQDNRFASADEMFGAIRAARRVIERSQPAPEGVVRPGVRRSTPPVVIAAPASIPIDPPPFMGEVKEGVAAPAPTPTAIPAPVLPEPRASDPFLTRQFDEPKPFSWRPTLLAAGIFLALVGTAWLMWPSDQAIDPVTPVAAEAPVEPVLPEPIPATPSGLTTPPSLPAGGEEIVPEPLPVPIAKIDPLPAPVAKPTVKPVVVVPKSPSPPAKGENKEGVVVPEPPVVAPPAPAPVVAAFTHVPITACGANRIEAKGPAGSVVKMRYRPLDPTIWQDPKLLREEAPGVFALTFGCSGDHATGFDYYLEATFPDGSKQKAGSASAPYKVR